MHGPTNKRAVTAAVMTATFLTAIDVTVVGTAMPTIIGTLGGLSLYSWVFSAYLLTSTALVPICGRLADMYGRKPVFLAGASVFVAGSALCGASSNMEQLVIFRGVQGLGASAVMPVAVTVVGDIFSLEQRAKVQGMLSSVWGIAAVAGPLLGAFIVDRLDWRWVFYVNLPFGVLAMLLFALFLHERVAPRRHAIDYAGTALMTAAVSILLLGLMDIGQEDIRMPAPPAVMIAVAIALIAIFVRHESRADEPVLPLDLFRSKLISVTNSAGFLVGANLMGLSSFVPPFVQGVLGGTAINAGAVLAPLSLGWPIGSTICPRLILRFGYRPVVLLGTSLIAVGSMMLLPTDSSTSQWSLMLDMLVIGLGMGFSSTAFVVAVQSSVDWGRRGVATASIQFFRSIGGAVGVAVMGVLMNSTMLQGLKSVGAASQVDGTGQSWKMAASVVLDPVARTSIPNDALEALRGVLASSLQSVYIAIAAAAIGALALTLLYPTKSAEGQASSEP